MNCDTCNREMNGVYGIMVDPLDTEDYKATYPEITRQYLICTVCLLRALGVKINADTTVARQPPE